MQVHEGVPKQSTVSNDSCCSPRLFRKRRVLRRPNLLESACGNPIAPHTKEFYKQRGFLARTHRVHGCGA